MGTTANLGTNWTFTVPGDFFGHPCYVVRNGNRRYRIAVDDFDTSKWRIDYADFTWCAWNDTRYASAESAAKALVSSPIA